MAFDQAKADRICEMLIEGWSLRRACAEMRNQYGDEWPSEATVRLWAMRDENGFSAQYTRAREVQAHTLAEEIRDISDTPRNGIKTKTEPDGSVKTEEGDMIEHRRLQVDARKWYLSKVLPKVYGEKITQEHTGANGGPLQVLLQQIGRSSMPVSPSSDED